MVFSSHFFIFYFLPLVVGGYYLLPRKARHLWLTILSYIFYGWANPAFIFLMFISTIIDYCCGLGIYHQFKKISPVSGRNLVTISKRTGVQTLLLCVSVCANLSLLGFFKYFNFFLSNYNWMMSFFGFRNMTLDITFKVALPLGISFYTFQSMSYTIDLYRGKVSVMKNFINFACYVSLFPQLVAGPIIRFSEVADQFKNRTHSFEKITRGILFLTTGLAKKVLIANHCGKIADLVFGASQVGIIDAWYGVTAYALQILFDFSGYSDMAIGLGLLLGFVFPKNFDSPYRSRSITEFWRRWHLSLSFWLRDYLYISLGGNRRGNIRTYVNILIVMLLGGLWHGAAWNFVIWGGIHGLLLFIERLRGKKTLYYKLPSFIQTWITFILILFTWVFFRADNLSKALRYCASMTGIMQQSINASLIDSIIYRPYYIFWVITGLVCVWKLPQTWKLTQDVTWPKLILFGIVFIIAIIVLTTQTYNPFIYFIF